MAHFPPALDATLTDEYWDAHYPDVLRRHAEFHFTPLAIADEAMAYLTAPRPPAHIVDIGAGAGKFCVSAALRHPRARLVGVELRRALVLEAHRWIVGYGLDNCRVREVDAAACDLTGYTGAYLFNPFYEHLDPDSRIDDSLLAGREHFDHACGSLQQRLRSCGRGFRLVTYFSHGGEVPEDAYDCVAAHHDDKLRFWVRK